MNIFVEKVLQKRIGIRACLARSSMDTGEGVCLFVCFSPLTTKLFTGLPPTWCEPTDVVLAKQQKLFDEFHNSADGRIRVWFAIRTIFNASDKLLRCTKEEAIKRKVGIHMHVAEIREEVEFCEEKNGATTVRHLEKCVGFVCVYATYPHVQSVGLASLALISLLSIPYGCMMTSCPYLQIKV